MGSLVSVCLYVFLVLTSERKEQPLSDLLLGTMERRALERKPSASTRPRENNPSIFM